jgi:hypothetical protein
MTRAARAVSILAGVLAIACAAGRARAAGPAMPRVAVLVGANAAAPGRKPLLYSHHDAERMAEVLSTVGGFPPAQVYVLRDPTPGDLLAAVEAGLAVLADRPDALFYFYYSGHADEQALYPAGRPLPLERVRALIDRAPVPVKIGMVDACRGGGWTRAADARQDQPSAARRWPLSPGGEGSVLIASSSGLESAHETAQLRGSFFTFHFAAGLRGAADRDRDGQVTLTEAFAYARGRTITDTLRQAPVTQHPSYSVNLRGREEVVLARLDASPTTLEIAQRRGPLQLVHAASGVDMVELPLGAREVTLALPPGRYLLRRPGASTSPSTEINVAEGVRNSIDEDTLPLLAADVLAQAAGQPPREESLPTAPRWMKVAAAGTAVGSALCLSLAWKYGVDGSERTYDDPFREEEHARAVRNEQLSFASGALLALVSAGLFYRWSLGVEPPRPPPRGSSIQIVITPSASAAPLSAPALGAAFRY